MMKSSPDTNQLLNLAAEGDPDAVKQLFQRFRRA